MSEKQRVLAIHAAPKGGYSVVATDGPPEAVFTTIDEALRYIRREMVGAELEVPDLDVAERQAAYSAAYSQVPQGYDFLGRKK